MGIFLLYFPFLVHDPWRDLWYLKVALTLNPSKFLKQVAPEYLPNIVPVMRFRECLNSRSLKMVVILEQ